MAFDCAIYPGIDLQSLISEPESEMRLIISEDRGVYSTLMDSNEKRLSLEPHPVGLRIETVHYQRVASKKIRKPHLTNFSDLTTAIH